MNIMKRILLFCHVLLGINAIAQIPTTGLIASYNFNGGAANDLVGDNDGDVIGATLTADRFGNANMAYSFDGVDDMIQFGDSSEFRFGTGDFAISFWFYYDVSQLAQIIGKRGSANNYEQYTFLVGTNLTSVPSADNSITAFVRTDGINREVPMGDLRSNWHHVVMNHYYGSETNIYVDGAYVGYATSAFSGGGIDAPGSGFNIGYFDYNGGSYFTGKVDDLYFYDHGLSTGEMSSLYNDQNPSLLSINEVKNSIEIYPNPANDQFTIQTQDQINEVLIYDLTGSLVITSRVSSVNISSLPTGLYTVQITTSKGIIYEKLIKE